MHNDVLLHCATNTSSMLYESRRKRLQIVAKYHGSFSHTASATKLHYAYPYGLYLVHISSGLPMRF